MKTILFSAAIGLLFLSEVTSTQGRSIILASNFQDPQTKKQNPSGSTPKPSPSKKGRVKKSSSINRIAVGDSSTQYKKANTDGNKTTPIDTGLQKKSNTTNGNSPK